MALSRGSRGARTGSGTSGRSAGPWGFFSTRVGTRAVARPPPPELRSLASSRAVSRGHTGSLDRRVARKSRFGAGRDQPDRRCSRRNFASRASSPPFTLDELQYQAPRLTERTTATSTVMGGSESPGWERGAEGTRWRRRTDPAEVALSSERSRTRPGARRPSRRERAPEVHGQASKPAPVLVHPLGQLAPPQPPEAMGADEAAKG